MHSVIDAGLLTDSLQNHRGKNQQLHFARIREIYLLKCCRLSAKMVSRFERISTLPVVGLYPVLSLSLSICTHSAVSM